MRNDEVELFHWNPRRSIPIPRIGRLPLPGRINNFGDLIGPLVTRAMLRQLRLSEKSSSGERVTLFTVGSVLHFASNGDVVWGTGINGKVSNDKYAWQSLDVRAVRGPSTRRWLERHYDLEVPPVYGDPALLLFDGALARPTREPRREYCLIPNLNDERVVRGRELVVSPRQELSTIVNAIATSEFVVTSSLHALIISELLGVPVGLVRPGREALFKYEDYVTGTQRDELAVFDTVEHALRHLRARSAADDPLSGWSKEPLVDAFPRDLFREEHSSDGAQA